MHGGDPDGRKMEVGFLFGEFTLAFLDQSINDQKSSVMAGKKIPFPRIPQSCDKSDHRDE
jgi:hypothetical protein